MKTQNLRTACLAANREQESTFEKRASGARLIMLAKGRDLRFIAAALGVI